MSIYVFHSRPKILGHVDGTNVHMFGQRTLLLSAPLSSEISGNRHSSKATRKQQFLKWPPLSHFLSAMEPALPLRNSGQMSVCGTPPRRLAIGQILGTTECGLQNFVFTLWAISLNQVQMTAMTILRRSQAEVKRITYLGLYCDWWARKKYWTTDFKMDYQIQIFQSQVRKLPSLKPCKEQNYAMCPWQARWLTICYCCKWGGPLQTGWFIMPNKKQKKCFLKC